MSTRSSTAIRTADAPGYLRSGQVRSGQVRSGQVRSGQVRPASQQEYERKAFAQAAQKELDELRNVICELKARVESANPQTKTRPGEEVKKLEAALRESQQHLMALKSATGKSWNQLKGSFGNSL
jgi:predicted RNA-binding Zn ribbon-like protein